MIDQTSGGTVPALPRHTLATRIVHLLFALAIVTQLTTSLFMRAPAPGRGGPDGLFQIHEYSGLLAFALAAIFWAWVIVRYVGADFGALVPWFSGERLHALWIDLKVHLGAVRDFRWPQEVAGPL